MGQRIENVARSTEKEMANKMTSTKIIHGQISHHIKRRSLHRQIHFCIERPRNVARNTAKQSAIDNYNYTKAITIQLQVRTTYQWAKC